MRRVFLLCLLIAAASGVSMAPAASWQNPGAPTEGRLVGFIPPPPPGGPSQFAMSSGAPAVFASGGPGSDPRRPCCGDAWDHIQTGPTTYNWSALDSWVNNALSHGVKPIYSFNEVSGYVNGGKPYSFPPTDVNTTNASATTFATKVMQRYCHTTTPPAAPGACDIETFEVWNEFNTGSNLPCTSCGFWSGTYLELAKMTTAFQSVVKLYCPTCKVYGGSTTAGGDGFNPGGGSSQFDVAMKQFLQAKISVGGPDFDGITFHPYCCRTNVFPEPFPSTIKSDSSPLCTGGVTSACRTPMMDQVALMRTALCDPSISSHYCGKPIGTTEGGFNHNNNLADSKNVSLSGSGTTVTATSSTDLPADWTTGTKVRIDLAIPTGFNTNADAYNTITVTGVRTFTYPSSMSGTSSSGLATTVTVSGGQVIWTDATWKIRQAWDMQWMMGLWQPGTEFDLLYVYDDRCWNTVKGSGAHAAQCPKDPIIPTSNTALTDSWNRMIGWFDHSTPGAGRVAHAVGSDTVYTMAFTHNGAPAMFVWFSGWRRATNWPTPAGYNRMENADGVVTTPGTTIPVENRPALLTSSGITTPSLLAPSRAIDWNQAGVVGGVPSAGWSQCGSTISAGASAATIQSAINGCGSNQYVKLGAGTFNLSTYLIMKSNMVLRGSGAASTKLIFGSGAFGGGCFLGGASICFTLDGSTYNNSSNSAPGQSNAATWTAGFAQNAAAITLTNVGSTGINNGDYIYLDQANDTTVGSGLFNCDKTSPACSIEGGSPGRTISGVNHSQLQIVKVTAGCSSACTGSGPFALTISPGLYGTNWSSGKAPGAWFPSTALVNSGIEDLTIDNETGMLDNGATINFFNAFNCWVSGVASWKGGRAHVWLFDAAHITIQNSYFYQTQDAASQSYGIEEDLSSDNLVVNNIMQQVTAPLMGGSQFGNTFAYNYMINHYQTASANCMYPAEITHDAGAEYNLWEGNFAEDIEADIVHGSSGLNTAFRNQFTGYESGKTCATISVVFDPYQREENLVGNILGTPGITSTYEISDPFGNGGVYELGNLHGGIGPDAVVKQTLLRWGNYDNVTGAARFCGNSLNTGWASVCGSTSEVPTGASGYPNPVPTVGDTAAGQAPMPASLIYAAKPSWWPSGKPWPAIGPDVTGGNIGICSGGTYPYMFATGSGQCTSGSFTAHSQAGHANSVPAMDCYLSLGGKPDGSGSAINFDASSCY